MSFSLAVVSPCLHFIAHAFSLDGENGYFLNLFHHAFGTLRQGQRHNHVQLHGMTIDQSHRNRREFHTQARFDKVRLNLHRTRKTQDVRRATQLSCALLILGFGRQLSYRAAAADSSSSSSRGGVSSQRSHQGFLLQIKPRVRNAHTIYTNIQIQIYKYKYTNTNTNIQIQRQIQI